MSQSHPAVLPRVLHSGNSDHGKKDYYYVQCDIFNFDLKTYTVAFLFKVFHFGLLSCVQPLQFMKFLQICFLGSLFTKTTTITGKFRNLIGGLNFLTRHKHKARETHTACLQFWRTTPTERYKIMPMLSPESMPLKLLSTLGLTEPNDGQHRFMH